MLIKSPCFTDDFGCFVTNSGVFEGFRAVAVAVDHEVGNSRQERMPTADVRSGEAIMMITEDDPWETHGARYTGEAIPCIPAVPDSFFGHLLTDHSRTLTECNDQFFS